MSAPHWLRALFERRSGERRTPAMSTTPAMAEAWIRESGYTGWYIVHCVDGVPKRIDFPYPEGLRLSNG